MNMINLPELSVIKEKHSLRGIDDIPEPYRNVFASYPHFNIIQSAIFNDVFYSDDSIVVSAPTGSGKTTIFELAIVKLLLNWETSTAKDFKIIYISPTKALCEERLVDWHKKFAPFNLSCISVTGDSLNVDIPSLINSKFIITTPEKWDSITRRWRENERIVQTIKLFMIDEIHLLNDETRGSTLEAIVTRMKTIHSCYQIGRTRRNAGDGIRLVGVSATIANAVDVAEWFGTPENPAKYFKFEDSLRPVKLQKIVQGYPYNPSLSSPFKFDIMLSYKLHNVLLQHSSGKPVLIFCSTRKSVEMTCKQLVQNLTIDLNLERKQTLVQAANSLDDSKLRESLTHGVACHHAGMLPNDRRKIETLFREGNLPVLITTSTLAMGVNLPAHLVVIKSTKYYANGEYRDYSESMLFQMIGRAGRPQFDTSAVAVIMTTAADKHKYENMVNGEQPIESHMHKTLAEHVNAEVVLRTITDLSIAMQWLSSTFFYIRARKNPRQYSLPLGLSQSQLDKKLLAMCQIEINKLAKVGMLTIDQNTVILPTHTGSLMAKYCAALETMKLFTQVTGNEVLQQILGLISKCREFSDIRLRTNDKRPLNILNQNRNKKTIRFPLSGRIKTLDMKINCIVQAVLGNLEISETSLLVEAQRIIRVGGRLLNCLSEYLQSKENCYKALLSSITLGKCFHARIWENSPYVSRQLEGIGQCLSNLLVGAGKTSFKEILDSNPRDLERILNKKPPFGNRIHDQVKTLPRYDLTVKEIILDDGKVTVELTLLLENKSAFERDITVNPDSAMTLLVGDSENNVLLHERYTHMYMIENVEVTKSVDIKTSFEHEVFANFVSEDWVGFDVNKSIKLFANEEIQQQNAITSAPEVQELPDSTNGKTRAMPKTKRQEKCSKSNMLQQCMDQFFKKVKTPKRDSRVLTRRRSAGQLRRRASHANLTVSKVLLPEDNVPNKTEEIVNEAQANISDETKKKLDENNNDNNTDAVVASIANSTMNVYKQNSTISKSKDETTSQSKIEFDIVPPTPIKLHQSVLRMRGRKLSNKRKHERNALINLEFENLVFNHKGQSMFDEFAMDPKKKLTKGMSHIESKKTDLQRDEDRDNSGKSLTWSSPLVTSPKSKFSPQLPKDASSEFTDNSMQKNLPSLRNNVNILSVADRDCENKDLKCIDIISQSFLESVGLKTTKPEDTQQHNSQAITTISGQDPLKLVKSDLNQSTSSVSSVSTIMSTAAKPKTIDSSSYYTRIIKQSYRNSQIELKNVASQTEDFSLNDQNNVVNNMNNNVKTAIQNQSTESNRDLEKNERTFEECNTNRTLQLDNNQKPQEKNKSIQLNNSWEEEFLSADPFFENLDTSFQKSSSNVEVKKGDKKECTYENLNQLERICLKAMEKNVQNFDASHAKEFDTEKESNKEFAYNSLNAQKDTRSRTMDQNFQGFDAMSYSIEFDAKNDGNKQYANNKLNPLKDTLSNAMTNNIQKFDSMPPYQNKLLQNARHTNLQNATLPKNLPEKNYSFEKLNTQKIYPEKRIIEQTNSFDSSFYKDEGFQDHHWMSTNFIPSKNSMKGFIVNERDHNDQSIFEPTFDRKQRQANQANHTSYFKHPQQYHTRTPTFENIPHISDIKDSNKFSCYENNFRNNYPNQNMNNQTKQNVSSDYVPMGNYKSNHQHMYFENTLNSRDVDFPRKQSQILSQNSLPVSDDFPEKLENITPSLVEPIRCFNRSNLPVRQPLPEHYENIRRRQFLHNPQIYSEHNGRYPSDRRFNGTNTNASFCGNAIDFCNDFNDGDYIKNQSVENPAIGYKHTEGRILPNYIPQQSIPIKNTDKINFSNHQSETISHNPDQIFQQNSSYPYHSANRRILGNPRHWPLEEPCQIPRHSQRDMKNKDDFLLSRYFNSYSNQNLFNFNEDILNLNHTITSDQIRNLSQHF